MPTSIGLVSAIRGPVILITLGTLIALDHAGGIRFSRTWPSYDPLRAGQELGVRHDGTPARAPQDGFIVFPNASTVAGNEWFYFAQPSARSLGA